MTEAEIQQRLLLSLSKGYTRLFRNNVALGWMGQAQPIRQHCTMQLRPGDVVIRNGRPLHAGLCPGSGDLIGWQSTIITPAMVSQRVAVFTSIEVKSAKGRASTEQRAWDETVRNAGGLSGIARSVDEARGILDLSMLVKDRGLD